MLRIDDAMDPDERKTYLAAVATVTSDEIQQAITDATETAIPSKATMLRNLMEHAAVSLEKQVDHQVRAESYNRVGPQALASMQEAATILRTVSIYVMDEGAPAA